MIGAVDQIILHRVMNDVRCNLAGIDAEAGDAHGVFVVKHQPAALLVGIIDGLVALTRIGHVGDVMETRTREVGGGILSDGSKPLPWRPVTDPGRKSAMEMQGCAVLCVISGIA